MKLKFNIFRIQEGKGKIWKDWCEHLILNYKEAIETLREEEISIEFCGSFKVNDFSFVILAAIAEENIMKAVNSDLNRQHNEKKKECLEFVDAGEELYLLTAK